MKRKPVIIIEGPDGAGKTTLIEHLRSRFEFAFTHHGAYVGEQDIAHHYLESMMPALKGELPVLLDRSWLAEPFYGRAFRSGADRVGYVRARMLERAALACRAVVIICLPKFETCAKNFMARKQLEYLDNTEQLKVVHNMYGTLQSMCELPCVLFNYEQQTFADVERLLSNIPKPEHDIPGAGKFSHGKQALLIVEQPVDKADLPFIDFSQDSPAYWLTRELSLFGVREQHLYWINAHGKPAEQQAWLRLLEPREIFALGLNAARYAKKMGVKFTEVPSPSTWQKTGGGKLYPLISNLRNM